MARFHLFFKTFTDDNADTYASDFIEVTDDVVKIGKLKQSLDNTEYDVGIFRSNNVPITLRNDHGLYSEVGEPESIFVGRRSNAIVKITWEPGDNPLTVGFFNPDDNETISEEITIFEGLLRDDTSKSRIDDQDINFNIIGIEKLFKEVDVPFATIGATDLFSLTFLNLLNQSELTKLLTVSAANIVPSTDLNADNKDSLENQTVLEAIKALLLPSNSVLYIEFEQSTGNRIVRVRSRDPEAVSSFTFFGPGASNRGIENTLDIFDFRNGVNRIKNFWTFRDTTKVQSDSSSITQHGVRKKEISLDLITDGTKQDTILTNLKNEFRNAKRELTVVAHFNIDTHLLFLRDRVIVDYPSVAIADDLPQYDAGVQYDGVARYPNELFDLTIDPNDPFHIIERQIDFDKQLVNFRLREI